MGLGVAEKTSVGPATLAGTLAEIRGLARILCGAAEFDSRPAWLVAPLASRGTVLGVLLGAFLVHWCRFEWSVFGGPWQP